MNESNLYASALDMLARPQNEEFNRSLLRAIQEASPNGILVVDEKAMIVAYNKRFLEIWRIPASHLHPDPNDPSIAPDRPILQAATDRVKDPEAFVARIRRLYANPNAEDHCEIELKDGRTIERISRGLRGDHGEYLGRVWFFRDISEQKKAEAALRELAWRDPLTGLLNRRHFYERAGEELVRAQRYGHPLALLMLDLDYFKQINDQHGHAVGDAVLEAIGRRWNTLSRQVDILARIGGEEFSMLLPDTELEGACQVAERLRSCVAEQGIATSEGEVSCTVSIGVSIVRASDNKIDELMHRADEALYRAKDLGRNRVEMNP